VSDSSKFCYFVKKKLFCLFFRGFNATVINVLDEMINIEYDREEVANTKRPATQWVETDNKSLLLTRLIDDFEPMVVEK
jgi:hypothetical protein